MASLRALSLLIVVAVLGTVVLAACSGGTAPAAGSPTARPATTVPTRSPAATGSPGPSGQLVITGQVREVDASARVITLVEPVHGLESIAITDKTQIQAADGSARTLQDVKPGVVIQAAGTAGGSNSVLATTIRILTAPSPIPQS